MTNITLDCTINTVQHDDQITLDLAELAPQTVAYLLQYGVNKTLQDCVAGRERKFIDAHEAGRAGSKAQLAEVATGAKLLGQSVDSVWDMDSAAFATDCVAALKAQRMAKLLAGEMHPVQYGARRAKVDPVTREALRIASGMISAVAEARKLVLSDEELADKAKQLVELGKPMPQFDGRTIREEAEHRLTFTGADVDDALDGLLD